MNPRDITWLTDWLDAERDKKHSLAVKYIEENVDLIDTDLQKFMDNCPSSCQLEVYEMLLKAGIDMKEYAVKGSLKQYECYIHDTSPYFKQYYTIDYKQKLDEYIEDTINWKTKWLQETIVLDTLPALEEA